MSPPNVLILRAPGTNCDAETAFAFERAGAKDRNPAHQPAAGESLAVPAVPDPLRSRRVQLRRRPWRGPNPRQPDPASPGRRACPIQGRRQADARHLQRVPGVDEVARAAWTAIREGPRRHAHAKRLRPIPGSLGADRSARQQERIPGRHRADVSADGPCRGEVRRPRRRGARPIGRRRPTRVAIRCRGQPQRGPDATWRASATPPAACWA